MSSAATLLLAQAQPLSVCRHYFVQKNVLFKKQVSLETALYTSVHAALQTEVFHKLTPHLSWNGNVDLPVKSWVVTTESFPFSRGHSSTLTNFLDYLLYINLSEMGNVDALQSKSGRIGLTKGQAQRVPVSFQWVIPSVAFFREAKWHQWCCLFVILTGQSKFTCRGSLDFFISWFLKCFPTPHTLTCFPTLEKLALTLLSPFKNVVILL